MENNKGFNDKLADALQELKDNSKQFSFNVNDFVKVKPTDKGKEIIQAEHKRICAMFPDWKPNNICMYPIDEDGYLEIQLRHFMRLFGPHFANGGPLLIEGNEIIFEVE